jgi:hypothetical protein
MGCKLSKEWIGISSCICISHRLLPGRGNALGSAADKGQSVDDATEEVDFKADVENAQLPCYEIWVEIHGRRPCFVLMTAMRAAHIDRYELAIRRTCGNPKEFRQAATKDSAQEHCPAGNKENAGFIDLRLCFFLTGTGLPRNAAC